MKINEAVKIVENSIRTRHKDDESSQAIICLMDINDNIKKKTGKKLFTFFDIVYILSCPNEALSYVVSNIEKVEELRMEELEE